MCDPRRILATIALVLAGCGSETSVPDPAPHGPGEHGDSSDVAENTREITVVATNFSFDPMEMAVEVRENIAIVLTSEGGLHDFTIDDLGTHVAAEAGETAPVASAQRGPADTASTAPLPGIGRRVWKAR